MADEVQNLILKVEGEIQLLELNKQLDAEKNNLQQLLVLKAQGAGSLNDTAINASAAQMVGLNDQIRTLNVQAKSFSGNSGLQLSYVMDDLANTSGNWQRHLASISNNMPGLLMSMGVGTGLAGQLAMVYTGFVVLLPVIQKFYDSITGQNPEAVAALEKIKKAAEEAADAFNKLVEKPTGPEEESIKALESLVQGPQGRQAEDAVKKAMMATQAAPGVQFGITDEDLPWEVKAARAFGPLREAGARATFQAQIEQNNQERIKRQVQGAAEAAFGKAFAGKTRQERDEGLSTIRGLQQARPDLFPAGFNADLGHSTEAGIAADEAEADAWQERMDNLAAQAKSRREAAARDKKENTKLDQLNNQGRDQQLLGDKDLKQDMDKEAKKAHADSVRSARQAAIQARHEAAEAKRAEKPNRIAEASHFFDQTDANPQQRQQLGEDMLRIMEQQGLPAMEAAQMAYANMSERIRRMEARFMQMQQGFGAMMGANNQQFGGQNFSFQSPMPGG